MLLFVIHTFYQYQELTAEINPQSTGPKYPIIHLLCWLVRHIERSV